ncbi:dendrin [Varanus komodoensis]|uniref:dendrin n=1 Tax=Varanus komodoensis TaxID=61221 RepID=UPI001CF7E02A|nr:dendrin [Varanus komodoensis]
MFKRFSLRDARQLRICERTNLLLVEFNAVSCSSRSAMEAGPWTGQGCSSRWMYHSMAGQYTLLEKQLIPDYSPCRRHPGPRVLQDSTNWHDGQLPPRWGLLKPEGHWFSGRELSRAASSPKAQRPQNPAFHGPQPVCRRDATWGASHVAKEGKCPAGGPVARCQWNLGAPSRAPPSYEAHMLLRLRAGQGPRKENWPRPPPYVAPPSYEAPHRTVQPQQRAQGEARAAKRIQKEPPRPCCKVEKVGPCEPGPLPHSPERQAARRQAKLPGSWSYLPGARTWGGPWMLPESAESPYGWAPGWGGSSPPQSHTLPRVKRRNKGVPGPAPSHALPSGPSQHMLPAGWGFSHAAGWPGALGNGGRAGGKSSRDLLPRWKEPGQAREAEGGQAAPSKPAPRRQGGLFVIDATCVVIQAHYIPPPRTERVRYVGPERPPDKARAPASPRSPAPASLEERAARILGLSLSELGSPEAGGSPRLRAGACGAAAGPAPGAGQPGGAGSAPSSPRKPLPAPAPTGSQAAPPEQGPRGVAAPCQEGGGPAQGDEAPAPAAQGRSYVRDLKEAMSRIRRHTAPDSDTEEELETESRPASARPPRRAPPGEGALSYSSSSSLDSSSSSATVVPGHAAPSPGQGAEEAAGAEPAVCGREAKPGHAVPREP